MLSKAVLPVPPLVLIEKLLRGLGLAVKPNDPSIVLGVFGNVFFTMWMNPGKTTASADNERSWLPPEPSRPTSRVWYGEPVMATAEFRSPQFGREAMWPPHARTGFATLAVKVIVIRADLSPLNPEPFGYE